MQRLELEPVVVVDSWSLGVVDELPRVSFDNAMLTVRPYMIVVRNQRSFYISSVMLEFE